MFGFLGCAIFDRLRTGDRLYYNRNDTVYEIKSRHGFACQCCDIYDVDDNGELVVVGEDVLTYDGARNMLISVKTARQRFAEAEELDDMLD